MTEHPYLTFGPANDSVGWGALVLGLAALALALFRGKDLAARLERIPSLPLVGTLALTAGLLSFLYLDHYLRGGPRIIDAASYWLEARTLSAGELAFHVPEPSGAFRGRFLLPTPDGRLSVIFPPGYPLALAAGFLVGAPLAVGPLLAALLVVATYFGVHTLLEDEKVARLAALLSTLCAALRYHTADTMAHGLSALLLIVSLGCAARTGRLWLLGAGLSAGWLVATRPVTGVVAVLLCLGLARRRGPAALLFLLALLPGLFLLGLHQRAATGSWLGSTQLAYYALSDGPPGCFRWGFGPGVGCRFEHGDFVKEHLQQGFGWLEAARGTLERLALHGIDIANLVPFALLVPWAAFRFRRQPGVVWLALGLVGVVLGYLPFYYPASYPGGGARLFADALPLEHGLLALGLSRLGAARFTPAGMLLGFALHGVHASLALAEREGGRPMLLAKDLDAVRRGLVFVGTDHAFLLGYDPTSLDPSRGIVVAREHRDAHDRVLWELLGRPPTYRFGYSPLTGETTLAAYQPPATLRFETEAEWPPLSVTSGWAHPDFRPCLSGGQGLHLRASPAVSVDISVTPPRPGSYELRVGWLADPGAQLTVQVHASRATLSADMNEAPRPGCRETLAFNVRLAETTRVRLSARQEVIVDYLTLTELEAKKR